MAMCCPTRGTRRALKPRCAEFELWQVESRAYEGGYRQPVDDRHFVVAELLVSGNYLGRWPAVVPDQLDPNIVCDPASAVHGRCGDPGDDAPAPRPQPRAGDPVVQGNQLSLLDIHVGIDAAVPAPQFVPGDVAAP
jgi:hypothetical protein